MNFNEFIRHYKNEIRSMLIDNNIEYNRIEQELAQVSKDIKRTRGIFCAPLPAWLTTGLVGGAGFGALFAAMFGTQLWIIYLIVTVVLSILGLINESYAKTNEEDRIFLNQQLSKLYREQAANSKQKQQLATKLNHVNQCIDYYLYVLSDEQKTKPVNIIIRDIIDKDIKLSTILHKYYNGELQEFLMLPQGIQLRQEQELRINEQIMNAKYNSGQPVQERRRRRTERFEVLYGEPRVLKKV